VIGLEQRAESKLELRTSPAVIAASVMLELPSLALESLVQDALDANPLLERLDSAECPACQDRWPTRCPVCSPAVSSGAVNGGAGGPASLHADRPAPETEGQDLLKLVRMAVRTSDVPIAEYIVASLDHHGLLDQTPREIARVLGTSESSVLRVLSAVRQNGPPGLGATSAAECLLLQLDSLDTVDAAARSVAFAVIADHLPALAKGHFGSIASALGVDRHRVVEVLELIREQLRPYPSFDGCDPCSTARVVPDLVISEGDRPGVYEVELVEPRRLRVRIVPNWAAVLEATSTDAAPDLRARMLEARRLLGELRDRWETVRLVACCTVERQAAFLHKGPSGLRPLTRADVAETLGMHESTVSRAVSGRCALLPSGQIVPMSTFFSASGGMADDLRKLVDAEERPLSDGELAERLQAAGYSVARRTVTKYRIRLGIAAALRR
jgi:RNA polymerase sigma-54 factor